MGPRDHALAHPPFHHKENLMRSAVVAPLLLLASASAGCERHPTEPPPGEVMLESLRFTQSTVQAGETLVLTARVKGEAPANPQPIRLSSSSGEQTTIWLNVMGSDCPKDLTTEEVNARVSAWESCTDAELTAAIAEAEGHVVIGFKEADAERGVDEKGQVLVSDETVKRMKSYIRERGIVIEHEYDSPGISAHMPAEVALVSALRGHDNIDYLEPVFPGTRLDTKNERPHLLASISTAGTRDGTPKFHAGDTVTAAYRQPDGSVLTATAFVQE
jgi:hypothetical protein